jgi:hypothetical protein
MARPKKDESLLMNEFIKIPVTTGQKEQIVSAAKAAGSDNMAAWVRQKLMEAAQEQAAKSSKAHGAKSKRQG